MISQQNTQEKQLQKRNPKQKQKDMITFVVFQRNQTS